ncbi:trichothecene 3-o-acetyltransferase [Trichoderma arundinaceum]|uniref:Trichothecene 3-o-acetyltransferase n=1 Tax=Trichoderma arundinaceum TaxID=490622 RepID=A0A395P0J8_TRIAR|nr:trichothecene 3-o-acetyltransferase [Trichoderma arundinaceum]
MPKQEVFHLYPLGWENDPEEEKFKFSTLDYLTACTYNNYVLFFKLDDMNKPRMVTLLKEGLSRTLSQARQLCGTIEKDSEGYHSFVKRKDSTVQFVVQWLDSPEDCYPSFDEIESHNFSSIILGDLRLWSIDSMMHGIRHEAHIDNRPVVSAFKANFVRGGLVFNMHHHHCANDVMGWASFTHQLAENCRAIFNNTTFPGWDSACLNLSRFTKPEVPEGLKIDGPPLRERYPGLMPVEALLFHLPKSKAIKLKKLAMPTDGTWISTYDAFSAFIWRTFSRIRAPIFKPNMTSKLFWGEAVNMRKRLHSPACHPRIQGNVMYAATSITAKGWQPTVSEVISESQLCDIASFIRQLTRSVNQEDLDKKLEAVAAIRDKSNQFLRTETFPPMSIIMTDWRGTNIAAADFGMAMPSAFRHLSENVTRCIVQVYPPRAVRPDSDEGCEFSVVFEKTLAKLLIEDPGWNEYFEYRGIL